MIKLSFLEVTEMKKIVWPKKFKKLNETLSLKL